MVELEYVAFVHTLFLPDNRFHNPACTLYRFSNFDFVHSYIV